MRSLSRWLGLAGLCIAVSLSAPAFAGSKEEASQFATNLGKQGLAAITTNQSDEQKRAALRSLFEQNVDVDWIAKFVLGQYWRTATPEQQKAYQAAYKDFLMKNYTTDFQTFEHSSFQVTQARDGNQPGEYIVTMTIKRPQQEDVHMDFRVREKNGAYRVYDIIVEGVSLLTSQRSEFASVVQRNGMDYLIQQIKAKAAAESSGGGASAVPQVSPQR
jgi:phospholipid transport system substrate-binding protein